MIRRGHDAGGQDTDHGGDQKAPQGQPPLAGLFRRFADTGKGAALHGVQVELRLLAKQGVQLLLGGNMKFSHRKHPFPTKIASAFSGPGGAGPAGWRDFVP